MNIAFEEVFTVGEDFFCECFSPKNNFCVTFEDDVKTGYFYGGIFKEEFQILDALHIYNDSDVIDKNKPSKLQITWSDDGMIASLLINNYCHAIFDFDKKAGYCRTGFPENRSGWANVKDRTLTEVVMLEIFENKKL